LKHAALTGWSGVGEPELKENIVAFNGAIGLDSFVIEQEFDGRIKDGRGFAFCKTGQLAYDATVVAVLTAFKHHVPTAEILSDGNLDDLLEGIGLYYRATDHDDGVNLWEEKNIKVILDVLKPLSDVAKFKIVREVFIRLSDMICNPQKR